ncbi:U11/U12 small nuclear ribonucleoprotein 48 kDa protein [Ziziphus jujuba]|uniref:U11/U12 small nuclear ribonucleoprotein 48 kDa protein n=1 Tax=Ziziphus jujuba TaxID=326968 RepID=A0ABM3HZV3_ZIZJJ|nr:U11/U12 small nuclear ribonucleoprotein 48 kDa protein [Ziziphus jujuba]XP_048317679.2 U11/U12 small nuclear ribonucleoprotein 48 kDa protein [Ziziphus jujuba]XP_048317681.2 U11/U12 small nuclear ribonucleoprotein 48 kDa protein [Ziziphus jujuba]
MSNPPAQFSNRPFDFLLQNQKSAPNFFNSQSQNPHPQNPNPLPPPDLSATLSSLNSLIQSSQQTLHSLSSLFPLQTSNSSNSNGFVACPFDPHHLMHPESLFAHSHRCPSSPYPRSDDNFSHLSYVEKTHKSADQSRAETAFLRTLRGSDAEELCFSLDDYYAYFGSNFFYRDCPGAVNMSAMDGASRAFALPAILSVQCANFVDNEDRKMRSFDNERLKILPSELWDIKGEVESWGEYPCVYSYRTLYAILGLDSLTECNLARRVISNSPRYGVVIDVAIRDHIVLLSRLCLKAIRMEALTLVNKHVTEMVSDSKSFNCPILVQALMWLASQLSILYGEMNGKLFSINILKWCILDAASGLLIFPLERKETEDHGLKEVLQGLDAKPREPLEESSNGEQNSIANESVMGRVVFVSQVATAIAALHERSLLEEKIKGPHISQPLALYQRIAEHDYVSNRANEERKNRPQYRPIIDHDGLPRRLSYSQDTSKSKTREELLAEERDYKRRRMSYRGKKGKRTTLEVMRDLIEDYTDEIKQAGGIGCFEKETDGGAFPSESRYASDVTTDVDKPTKINYGSSTAGSGPNHFKKQLQSNYSVQSIGDYEEPSRGFHDNHGFQVDQRSVSRHRRDREYYSRSPEKRRSHGQSHGQTRHQEEGNDLEVIGTKHYDIKRQSSSMSKRHRSTSSVGNSHHSSKVKDRDTYKNHGSQTTFEDRYIPSKYHGISEDDVSTNSNYSKPDKLYVKNYQELPSNHTSAEQFPDYHEQSE